VAKSSEYKKASRPGKAAVLTSPSTTTTSPRKTPQAQDSTNAMPTKLQGPVGPNVEIALGDMLPKIPPPLHLALATASGDNDGTSQDAQQVRALMRISLREPGSVWIEPSIQTLAPPKPRHCLQWIWQR
jgi:hypothetical protein